MILTHFDIENCRLLALQFLIYFWDLLISLEGSIKGI